jgi:hypothetical protein
MKRLVATLILALAVVSPAHADLFHKGTAQVMFDGKSAPSKRLLGGASNTIGTLAVVGWVSALFYIVSTCRQDTSKCERPNQDE